MFPGIGAGGVPGQVEAAEIVVTAKKKAKTKKEQPLPKVQQSGTGCIVGLHKIGESLAKVGEFVENVGYVGATVGAATGVGGAGGLAVAAVGDVIQAAGYSAQFFAGDRNAGSTFLVSLLPGPKTFVPTHLRNDLGDALSDAAYSQAIGATRPKKPSC
jgi:hypothetical protein